MKRTFIKLLTGTTLLSSALLTGCGGTVVSDDITSSKQPINTLKIDRTTEDRQETDWTWYVHTQAQSSASNLSFDIKFDRGIPSEVEHLQYFLDTDNQASTGFSYGEGSYEISGADYLIEDGDLYKSNSRTTWDWTYIGKFSQYTKNTHENGTVDIHISSQDSLLTSIVKAKQLNISIEPFNQNWDGTYSTISTQKVMPEISDEPPVVQPPVVQPPVVQPPVVEPSEKIYEDAEDGISPHWITVKGDAVATRLEPGYKHQSSGAVHLFHKWRQDAQGNWINDAEYHLPMHDTKFTKLSVDIVGNGSELEHYSLGVKILTQQGERILLWDSFYNHENLPAKRTVYDNGAIFIISPSPVELVRGYGYSSRYLEENFIVDLEATLKQFEPDNEIISVETFIATGGNLDNIKLTK